MYEDVRPHRYKQSQNLGNLERHVHENEDILLPYVYIFIQTYTYK